MMPATTLSLTKAAHEQLQAHLFPGDGKEAAAVLVCTRVPAPRFRLLVKDVVLVPHHACSRRTENSLCWPGSFIEAAIDLAEPAGLSIMLLHSHPTGYPDFSRIDDESDNEVIPCLQEAIKADHGSAVMLPDGRIFGRIYAPNSVVTPVDLVSVAGDNLNLWWRDSIAAPERRPMAFTPDMSQELGRLTACVIGVSGTGSVTAEQLCRLGFGHVIGIDHDHVEEKNLNRILNTTLTDAKQRKAKVHMFAERINQLRSDPFFTGIDADVMSRRAVLAASQADVIFCCVDRLRGRMVADRLAATFLLPLVDVGVAIPTRKTPEGLAISEVTGRVDYVYPGGSSLADRGVYSAALLHAEALAEADPTAHADQVRAGYIEGMPEQAPAVIALNMRASSASVMEFIARTYPFRQQANREFARIRFMLAEAFEEREAESAFTVKLTPLLGAGAVEPLLGLPVLGTH
ncbi:ThiF family adenylyltransferase [Zoogloea sp. LCSB751]|uniref:ThiF family adenylyltransferase n=1 Tax=Zoogloea sp. LCSB751 TaxID=1965277 RepID=UPI0009A4BFAE|nr:ThiF family adenylyltransferase [Zoogloea sp. LCSB751]